MAGFDVLWTEDLISFNSHINFFVLFRTMCVSNICFCKEKWGHRTSKIVISGQSRSNGNMPYYCSFYYLVRTSMDDEASEFTCTERMRRNSKGLLELEDIVAETLFLVMFPEMAKLAGKKQNVLLPNAKTFRKQRVTHAH